MTEHQKSKKPVSQAISSTDITLKQVMKYRNKVMPGDIVKGPQGKNVIIFEKHRWIALTDKGALQWIDLYMFNVKNVDFTKTDYIYFER